ncbi:site-2 protease family protein [Nocardia sp. CDC160]|uniref:site-2 protease family protein n=1 Tax=Nocardia sp. CDC160 TaxID=3112166 RepID=UPI002DBBB838|nr:site-2 protease family protein [Nocardia sp. CDC160]MEC3918692.1 site-2 protease family protein [Nocardia sp. CDC160]
MIEATLPLGRIAGVRIGAHWSALVTIGLFTWILGAYLSGSGHGAGLWVTAVAGALLLTASLLAHELAHSILARRKGIRVRGIVLWLLGGVSEIEEEPADPRTDLAVAVAGPATSLAIALVALAAAALSSLIPHAGVVTAMLVWLATVNAVLAVFNLLPGAPLDGGRVLRAILWRHSGDRLRAATTAARTGQVIGTTLVLLGVAEVLAFGQLGGLWLVLLGWFLRTAAHSELVGAGLRHQLGDTRVRAAMTPNPIAIATQWTLRDLLASPAPHTSHRVFPVVDAAGRPFGVLAWSDLAAIPESQRPTVELASLARKLTPAAVARPDELLSDVMCRVMLRPNLDAIVVVDLAGRLIGLLTTTDLVLAADRSALGLPVAPSARAFR